MKSWLRIFTFTAFTILVAYVMYYLVNSASGYYMPREFGVYLDEQGNRVLGSRRLEETWVPQPFGQEKQWFVDAYEPLVFLDHLFWHPPREQTAVKRWMRDLAPR